MFDKCVTCNKCGLVYMEVSRAYAEEAVRRFNEFFFALPKEKQDDFYGGHEATLEPYLSCWCNNSYKNFRDSKQGDCPDGVTVTGIIDRNE